MNASRYLWISMTMVLTGFSACQRDKSGEQSGASQPAGMVEQAVQQTVEGIKGPIDKARGVEETLGQAAERTAEQTRLATP
jgi:hypothetical protein